MFSRSLDEIITFEAGDATHLKEVINQVNGGQKLPYSLAYATLKPGESSLPHILQKSSELYIIVSGTGQAQIDNQCIDIHPGKVFLVEAGENQYLTNTGSETLAFYCVVAPPWNINDEVILNEDFATD